MTVQEQQFLIALLNLSDKLKENDTTVIDDIAVIKTYTAITEENKTNIENIIDTECNQATILNKDLLKQVVNSIDYLDKEFLLESITFSTFDRTDTEAYKAYINNLLSKIIAFKNPKNEFIFYSRIVNVCIYLRDSSLIKKAIDKLHSLHATTL